MNLRLLLPIVLLAAAAASADPLQLPDGSRYEGELQDGVLTGQGTLVWPNGARYEGSFSDGLMHGAGTWTSPAGDRYQGDFANGMKHGQGVLDYADGSRYEGQFEQDYPSGSGTLAWSDGTRYHGEFRYGLPWGHGLLTGSDGRTYEGEYERGWEQGEGTLALPDGTSYSGRFERGEPVSGRWEDGAGSHYEGGFSDWTFAGEGTYQLPDGTRYRGRFEDGAPTGHIVYESPDGSRYEGEMLGDLYHGEGRLTTADGEVIEGRFEYGRFQGAASSATSLLEGAARWVEDLFQLPTVDPDELIAEQSLYQQDRLLTEAIDALSPQRPDVIDLYAIHFAGHGSQEVFRREAEYARDLFETQLGAANRVLTLANSRTSVDRLPMATRESLRRALAATAERMDPEQDILFLYLTSHGSEDHELSIEQNGMDLPDLSAAELGAMLRELPIRNRVVVVSACFSGGFIPYLADDHTLVMTAARADRTSFGCADENEFTEFGRALLEDGLGSAESFVAAFEQAAQRVREQELEREIEQHSEPQIARAPAVEARLHAWRDQGSTSLTQASGGP